MDSLPATNGDSIGLTDWQMLKVIAAHSSIALILPFALYLYFDYLAFLALGPGGTPSNVAGFLKIKFLSLLAVSNLYEPLAIPKSRKDASGYLGDLPERSGSRPETRGIAPHRQVTQKASKAVVNEIKDAIESLAVCDDRLLTGVSCLEKHGLALFRGSCTRDSEICHLHNTEGSIHIGLHPNDARTVLQRGWGERHPLARGGWCERFVSASFVLVYAPQNETEIDLVMSIVQAGARYQVCNASGSDASRARKGG